MVPFAFHAFHVWFRENWTGQPSKFLLITAYLAEQSHQDSDRSRVEHSLSSTVSTPTAHEIRMLSVKPPPFASGQINLDYLQDLEHRLDYFLWTGNSPDKTMKEKDKPVPTSRRIRRVRHWHSIYRPRRKTSSRS